MSVKEDAAHIFCVDVPKDVDAPFARTDTTGAKLPNSVCGGNKTFTFAVAGDHDGLGTAQRCSRWRNVVCKWRKCGQVVFTCVYTLILFSSHPCVVWFSFVLSVFQC